MKSANGGHTKFQYSALPKAPDTGIGEEETNNLHSSYMLLHPLCGPNELLVLLIAICVFYSALFQHNALCLDITISLKINPT